MLCFKCSNPVPDVCPKCYSDVTVQTMKRLLSQCERDRNLLMFFMELMLHKKLLNKPCKVR